MATMTTYLNFVDGSIVLEVLDMCVRALRGSGQGVQPPKLNPIVQVWIAWTQNMDMR